MAVSDDGAVREPVPLGTRPSSINRASVNDQPRLIWKSSAEANQVSTFTVSPITGYRISVQALLK